MTDGYGKTIGETMTEQTTDRATSGTGLTAAQRELLGRMLFEQEFPRYVGEFYWETIDAQSREEYRTRVERIIDVYEADHPAAPGPTAAQWEMAYGKQLFAIQHEMGSYHWDELTPDEQQHYADDAAAFIASFHAGPSGSQGPGARLAGDRGRRMTCEQELREWKDLARRLAHVEIARREVVDGVMLPEGPDFEDGCRTAVIDDDLAKAVSDE